jgi:hypothetical protein
MAKYLRQATPWGLNEYIYIRNVYDLVWRDPRFGFFGTFPSSKVLPPVSSIILFGIRRRPSFFFFLEWEQRKILKILNNRKEFGEFFRHWKGFCWPAHPYPCHISYKVYYRLVFGVEERVRVLGVCVFSLGRFDIDWGSSSKGRELDPQNESVW